MFLHARHKTAMPRYRIDITFAESDRLAMHEVDYDDDQAAIQGGHAINGFPTIGAGFRVWRDDELVYWHANGPHALN
jgi:hypothetical protein